MANLQAACLSLPTRPSLTVSRRTTRWRRFRRKGRLEIWEFFWVDRGSTKWHPYYSSASVPTSEICLYFAVDRSSGLQRRLCIVPLSGFFTSRCEGYRLKLLGIHSNQLRDIHEIRQIDGSCWLVVACHEFA